MERQTRFVNSLTFQLDITAKIFQTLAEKKFNTEVKNRITLEEYVILDTLICYPHLDKNGLAKTLVREKAAVEKILHKLLKRKLIKEVKPNGIEIQLSHYELTKEGSRIYQEIVPKNDMMVGLMAKFMTESELVTFTKSLLKMRNILISLSDIE